MGIDSFEKPIYVTRPLLPDMEVFSGILGNVWEAKWLTNMGQQHKVLEGELKKYLGVSELSLFNNGTIALIVALKVLGLSGEVITTPFTFPATVHALQWNGLTPVFCDIDPKTLNIDVDKIEKLITSATTGILPVHVFGTPCDVSGIQRIADKYDLKVIYDAAHAFGVEENGEGVGNYGDISMFSFHATKLFHTAEGGALTYQNVDLERLIYYAKNFGIKSEDEVVMVGINGKMNELEAALGLCVLDLVNEEIRKRKRLMELYVELLKDVEGITVRTIPDIDKFNYQYFYILIDELEFGCSRNDVYEKFKRYNVFTRRYFYPLCSNYSCYRALHSADLFNLSVANKVGGEVLLLPLYGGLSEQDVKKICNILKGFHG